jgi:mannose-6-phosphate isomerase-like protein (cupin superfamily)
MIVHDLGADATARMTQVDLAALGREPDSPIGQFSFHDCTGGVAAFTGAPPWERHTAGDELLFVLTGESVLTVIQEGAREVVALRAGHLAVVPQSCWHHNGAESGVTFLYMTPATGNEHSWDDPVEERS